MKSYINKIPHHRKGLIFISITALLWSSSGLFIKVLSLNVYQISFYRSGIAALTIFIITLLRKQKVKFHFDTISNLCALSYAGVLLFFVAATKLTTAANAIFLQFTAPMYLVVLEPIFLKTKFEVRNLVTLLICLIGMFLFFFGKLEIGNIYGNIFAILSGISFAFFSLFLKWKKQKHNVTSTISNIIIGNALISLISFPFVFSNIGINFSEFLMLLFMGVLQIGVSYVIFNEGIKYVSATESMIIAMMETIFNPIWVFIGIGELPSKYAILGGIIILFAIIGRNIFRKNETGLNNENLINQ